MEITAISVHAYAYVADKYAILTHGASMGDNYGPMVVTREPVDPSSGCASERIAIPGTMTSAFLALRLFLGDFEYDIVPFDEIMEAVSTGKAEAGLLIHEGQLTHQRQFGLHSVVDLGKWWHERTGGLPLPLGVNAVRRDLGPERWRSSRASSKRASSTGWSTARRRWQYAMHFARGLPTDDGRPVRRHVRQRLDGRYGRARTGEHPALSARGRRTWHHRARGSSRFHPITSHVDRLVDSAHARIPPNRTRRSWRAVQFCAPTR